MTLRPYHSKSSSAVRGNLSSPSTRRKSNVPKLRRSEAVRAPKESVAMPEPFKLVRIPSLKTVEDFRAHLATLGVKLPCEDAIATGAASPLTQPLDGVRING